MKFSITKTLLEKTLNVVSKGLSVKTPMPILTGIFVDVKDDQVIFTTTNREISVRQIIYSSSELEIREKGSCLIPGKYFVEIVKKIADEYISIELFDENSVKILAGNSDFTLVAYEKNYFPKINFEFESNPVKLTCKELKQLVRQTAFACAASESKAVLTGVNFSIKDNELTAIATDSYRLARKNIALNDANNRIQFNIPSKSLEELNKILPDSIDSLTIYAGNNQALFKFQETSFVSRLIEGTFPDIQKLFNSNPVMEIKFRKSDLIAAIDRASLFSTSDNLNVIKLSVTPYSDCIEISSSSNEIGRVVETVPTIDFMGTEHFQIYFTAKNALDAVRAFDSETVKICFVSEIRPAIFESDETKDLTQLITPLKLN